MITEARVAHEVREYIEEYGWIQGKSRDFETGAVCLLGALDAIRPPGEMSYAWNKEVALECALRRLTGAIDIIGWNDAPGRTYEDVILLLKRIETGDVDST